MKAGYIRAMDLIHRLCLWISAVCILIITLIVPWGVFVRYVLSDPANWPGWLTGPLGFLRSVLGYDSSWPEPMAILLMIVLSFLSAVVCYREYLHIGVGVLPAFLGEPAKTYLGWFLEACMLATNLFMLWWGLKLVQTTWYQSIPEFPIISAGVAYLPIPIGGTLTSLFVIERFLTQKFFSVPELETVAQTSTE